MVVREVGVLQRNDAGIVVVVTMVVEGATDVVGATVVDEIVVVGATVVVGLTVVLGGMVVVETTVVVGAGKVVVVGTPTCATSNAEYARRFGLPAPILNNAPAVELAMSSCSTCC